MSRPVLPPAAYLWDEPTVALTVDAAVWLYRFTNVSSVFAARGRDGDRRTAMQIIALLSLATSATSARGSDSVAGVEVLRTLPVSAAVSMSELGASTPLTTTQVAEQLKISDRAVRLAICGGRLTARRHGRSYLIDPADLDDYLARRRRTA